MNGTDYKRAEIMTRNEFNLTVIMSLLPSLADYLEDFGFKYAVKQQQTRTINEIRKLDKLFMNTAENEVIEQQLQIQQVFRQWLEEKYNETIKQ